MRKSDQITAALAVATAAFVSAPAALQAQGTTPGTVVRRRVPGARDPGLREPGQREPRFKLSVEGQAGRVDLPRRGGLLGLENNIARPEIRFEFEPDGEADFGGAEARIDIDTTGVIPAIGPESLFGRGPAIKRTWLGFGLGFRQFDTDRFLPQFDPQGDALLLPGPQGGPSGFRLTDPFRQGANIATNLRYRAEYDTVSGFAEYGQKCFYTGGWGIGCYLGAGFTRLDYRESFMGKVPGFSADFNYGTDLEVDNWRLYKGVDAERWFTPHVAGFVRGDVGLNFLDAGGRDRLDFNFFGGNPTSINRLGDDGTDWSLRAGGGVKFRASLLEGVIGGFWEREAGVPVLQRQGQEPSFVSLDHADSWGAYGRLSLGFGDPPPSVFGIDSILTY